MYQTLLPVQEDSALRQAFGVSVVATFEFCSPFVVAVVAEVIVVAVVVGRLAAVEEASGAWDLEGGEV